MELLLRANQTITENRTKAELLCLYYTSILPPAKENNHWKAKNRPKVANGEGIPKINQEIERQHLCPDEFNSQDTMYFTALKRTEECYC